jgi:Holliday junction resolvase RusA-like endonuclease
LNNAISFFVPGVPKPAGSKKAFYNQKTGRAMITDDSGQPGKDWRSDVKTFAWRHRPESLLTGPVVMNLTFYFARPKGHFGTGRNSHLLKNSAPKHHIIKPDTTKVTRAVEDALTGVIWKDDSQVVDQHIKKRYAETPGVHVEIRW